MRAFLTSGFSIIFFLFFHKIISNYINGISYFNYYIRSFVQLMLNKLFTFRRTVRCLRSDCGHPNYAAPSIHEWLNNQIFSNLDNSMRSFCSQPRTPYRQQQKSINNLVTRVYRAYCIYVIECRHVNGYYLFRWWKQKTGKNLNNLTNEIGWNKK